MGWAVLGSLGWATVGWGWVGAILGVGDHGVGGVWRPTIKKLPIGVPPYVFGGAHSSVG